MHSLRNVIDGIRQMRIVPKLTLGYILLIVIPFTLFGFFFYRQMYDNLLVQYLADKEKFMEQALANMEIELSKIESIYPLFQNNDQLTEYLDGRYETDWEMIYNYGKTISPTFSFAYTSNPNVKNVMIYKTNPKVLSLEPDILNMDRYEGSASQDEIRMLRPNQGMWTTDTGIRGAIPSIYYTKKLFNDTYTRELGFLQIKMSNQLLQQVFNTLPGESVAWKSVLDQEGKFLYEEEVPGWSSAEMTNMAKRVPASGVNSYYVKKNQYLVHAVSLPKLQMTLLEVGKVGPILNLKEREGWSIAAGVLLLCFLSAFYFTIASSIAKRLVRFSRHLKHVDDPKLAIYSGKSGTDEIGFLIKAYNAMIRRIDELAQDIRLSDLMKKEAEIKMLQAQIKPHFLYNTLETMRMMALVKNETELAEVALSLGNLLRYSLAKNKDEATFYEELENVRNYIEIHRVRMGERLQFDMEVIGDLANVNTPRFILQPIIENSILHGLGRIRGKGIISLMVEDLPDRILIRITDNGGGIPEQQLAAIRETLAGGHSEMHPNATGIGLRNVNERIKSYFGGDSGIRVESRVGHGTVFEICLDKERRHQRAEIIDRG
jgi:two-component system sensor histidine kinase YesM